MYNAGIPIFGHQKNDDKSHLKQ